MSIDQLLKMTEGFDKMRKEQKALGKSKRPKGIFKKTWDAITSFMKGTSIDGGIRPVVPPPSSKQ